MREHQIVITLKPEHFQEIQKLSRAAGAKSMGMFVRQQLLAALGIEGKKVFHPETSSGADTRRIVAELRQLHRELRAFVADSLSKDYNLTAGQSGPVGQNHPAPLAGDTDMVSANDAESSSSPTVDQKLVLCGPEDELEQIAQRAFAISPRLGAIDAPAHPHKVKRDPLEELLDDTPASGVEKAESESREVTDSGETQFDDLESLGDETIDVPLPLKEKSRQASAFSPEQKDQGEPKDSTTLPGKFLPPSNHPPFSGGPPPRRRQ